MVRISAGMLFIVAVCGGSVAAQPSFPPSFPQTQTPPPQGPAAQSPPAQTPDPQLSPAPLESDDPVVVGQMEHLGWSLTGPRAKHYIFGGLAVADYVWLGKRRIVTLQEQTELPKPDPDYLYYRELRDGNWWAFRKHPWPDRTYSVWFRPADAPAGSKWRRLQMANLQMTGQ